MIKLRIDEKQLNMLEIYSGVLELTRDYIFSLDEAGIPVALQDLPGDGLSVTYKDGSAVFSFDFTRRNHFFRCLSLFLQHLQDGDCELNLEEKGWFKRNGPAIDMSQGNSAMTVSAIQNMLRKMAMMGLSQFVLYLEETLFRLYAGQVFL